MASEEDYDRLKEVKEFDESKIGVKGLSDSGITSIPRFFHHPPNTLSQLKRSSSSSSSIQTPVIDLSGLDSPHHRPDIVHRIRKASKKWGFFQVINHGVPPSVLEETVNAVKAFHDLPLQEKAKHYVGDEKRGVRFAVNNDLYRSEAATWHDHLQVWMAPEPPEAELIPEICRREVLAWDTHAKKVADDVMELLSEGLGLEGRRFRELTFSEARLLAGICYPHCPQPDLTMGIASHSDPGVLTVLLQNHVPGLQVKHGEEWVDVKPVTGGLIINAGDFLQIVSNGEYQSVQHRVLANPYKEPRISVVMFFNLGKWEESGLYGPLPELLSPEKPAIYRNFTLEEYNHSIYSQGLNSKSFIQKITI